VRGLEFKNTSVLIKDKGKNKVLSEVPIHTCDMYAHAPEGLSL
jgi:hypothetical protein